MLQTTTTKRPPSLTLSGARIFKQRLATIRKHRIGSQEGRYFIYDYYYVPKHTYYILLYIIIIITL